MADYNRMVSYMYQYEKGNKKKNVGYVRVETRNGECKFTIHMQLLGVTDSIFPTYLILRDKKETELIYLGDSMLRNQVMDSKMVTLDNNIGGSGHRLADFRGMVLFYNDDVFFATEWTDRPILMEELLLSLNRKHYLRFPSQTKLATQQKESSRESRSYNYNRTQRREETGTIRGMEAVDTKELLKEKPKKIYQRPKGWKYIEAGKEVEGYSTYDIPQEAITQNYHRFKITRHVLPKVETRISSNAIQEVDHSPKLNWEIEEEDSWLIRKEAFEDSKEMQKEIDKEEDSFIDGLKEEKSFRAAIADGRRENIRIDITDRTKENVRVDTRDKTEEIRNDTIDKMREAITDEPDELDNDIKVDTKDGRSNEITNPRDIIYGDIKANINDVLKEKSIERNYISNDIVEEREEGIDNRIHADTKASTIDDKLDNIDNQKKESIQDDKDDQIFDGNTQESSLSIVDRLLTHYPRMYPFEDKNLISCVKIEPKDINLFPQETRVLINNSFLMHGYYCYNHLIFAKLKDRQGIKYIIGVPGIYHNRERFMARMFGFDYFKSVKKRQLRAGDFGYWFIPILL